MSKATASTEGYSYLLNKTYGDTGAKTAFATDCYMIINAADDEIRDEIDKWNV